MQTSAELPLEFVLEHRSFKLGREESLVRDVALANGRQVRLASLTQMQRQRIKLNAASTVAVGGIPFIKAALQALGRPLPEPDSYPQALRTYLHREVEVRPLKAVLAHIDRTGESLFMKPASRAKSFTGCVPEGSSDFRLQAVSRNQRVWVAAPVAFVSEWRVYVLNEEIRHISWYAGSREVRPDSSRMKRAVSAYLVAGAPVGFAIDFGVLSTGETALVEANDGFSVGAYEDVDPFMYTALLSARWFEMASGPLYEQKRGGTPAAGNGRV